MDRIALLHAVNVLVSMQDAETLFGELTALLPTAKKLGVRFTGDRAVVNPLLELALDNEEQFQSVIELIERKRAEAGLPPMQPPFGGFNKTAYQREFMQAKRERERRAAAIENMNRSERTQLRGRSRLDFMQAQAAKWKDRRDRLLEQARMKAGRRLRRDEVDALLQAFWSTVDRELDELEQAAKLKAGRPVSMKK